MRRILIMLFMSVCGFWSLSAQAASFDCDKAESIFEYAICHDDELSFLDERLSEAYKTARTKVSTEAAAEILAGQRRWHEYAQNVCIEDMTYPMVDYGDEGIQCLRQIFSTRIDTLAGVGARDGLVVYSRDYYQALFTSEPDEWSRVADHRAIVPQIDGDDAQARAFNALMQQAIPHEPTGLEGEEGVEDATTYSTDTDAKIVLVSPTRISVQKNDYFYGHGAAHGNYGISYMHFLRAENRMLVAQDIFVGSDWVQAITPEIINSLKEQLGEDGLWEDLAEIGTTIANPTSWALSPEGFTVQFQPYEVSAYAAGAPEARVRWSQLMPYLARDAGSIIGLN